MSRFKLNVLACAIVAGLAGMAGVLRVAPSIKAHRHRWCGLSFHPAPATNLVLQPGPNDPQIAYVTARLLEEFHYSQQLLDKKVSARFFDTYVDELDPRHENFLQDDLAEFAFYRTKPRHLHHPRRPHRQPGTRLCRLCAVTHSVSASMPIM